MAKKHWLLTAACVLLALPVSAQTVVFDFESGTIDTDQPSPLGFGTSVLQTIGDFTLNVNIGNVGDAGTAFQFVGGGDTFNIAFQVDNATTGDEQIEFMIDSITIGDVQFISEAMLFGGQGEFSTTIDASDDPDGDNTVEVTTDGSGNPLSDISLIFANISFVNDDSTVRGTDDAGEPIDFGVDFPFIDNVAITIPGFDEGLAGDLNGDDLVNAADFALLRDGLGESGDVATDFDTFAANFTPAEAPGVSAATAAVPEPSALLLLLLGAPLVRCRIR